MSTTSFSEKLATEWQRLNPKLTAKSNSMSGMFVLGFKEGVQHYFAPLLLLKWLVKYLWNLVIRRA